MGFWKRARVEKVTVSGVAGDAHNLKLVIKII